ncbi:MAG: DUF3253 domain-containing protein [Acidobacteria bacterium]|nr:DUF3253 domain-containing protein [Acidobacteriota bacterium]
MPSFGEIENTIFALLNKRRTGGTICPSEVARLLEPEQWKTIMHSVREVAAQLALQGRLVATQHGKEVNALSARGPIRLNLAGSTIGKEDHQKRKPPVRGLAEMQPVHGSGLLVSRDRNHFAG